MPMSLTPTGRKAWLWPVLAVAVGLVVLVLFWFQPQKLFIDESVDDQIPTVVADTAVPPGDDPGGSDPAVPGAAGTPTAPAEPVELARGDFISIDHGTSGVVRVLELADGTRIVRLEDLDTDNGPDLFLYLSPNPSSGPEGAFDDGFVNLGRLQGNKGNQNYDLAADIDLSAFESVVVWCERFSSAFGAADLKLA